MREIIFRGKRVDNGEWCYGAYYKQDHYYNEQVEKHCIITSSDTLGNDMDLDFCEVIPETVGQFTGLIDNKNGNKIFEGDIVVSRYPNGKVCSVGDIQFDCGVFGVEWTHHKKHKTMVGGWGQLHNLRRLDDDFIEQIEVIGNIHDNKELLGE